ncbi:MAG TPA: NAD(P)-dependent oxidoreductase [Burkholderiaceae bacterium]|nr:NAD(P)-dependent oxidoreductase [Burkholderiaceae bacterium]
MMMRILFTGGSSFTGYWLIKELTAAGHKVIATFRRRPDQYPDKLRRQRVDALTSICQPLFGISFGDERFIALIKDGHFDIFCHHGADATNYRSPDFDAPLAVTRTTQQLPLVVDALLTGGCGKIIITGSVFENDEGAGSDNLRAFSPYGLSKAFTWQTFRYYAQIRHLTLGKFVIPNPFGPYEEPRFTYYLIKTWFAGQVATVKTPLYVRDNIHVSLLARSYVHYATSLPAGISRINPSGYVESQGTFANRVADALRDRLGLKCALELVPQSEFSEPHIRINTDPCDAKSLDWNETAAWDEFATYYSRLMANS